MVLNTTISQKKKKMMQKTNEHRCKTAETNVWTVASWFLNQNSLRESELQRLCYFAQYVYIARNNDTDTPEDGIRMLFPEKFEAWINGPVCRRIYDEFRSCGIRKIPKSRSEINLPEKAEKAVREVWDCYKDGLMCDFELDDFARATLPWIIARGDAKPLDACTNEISNILFLNAAKQKEEKNVRS